VGSLTLRPGDSLTIPKMALSISFTGFSLTIPKMALSIGFTGFVSFTDAIQATRSLTSTSVGLTPTEHASLCWTH